MKKIWFLSILALGFMACQQEKTSYVITGIYEGEVKYKEVEITVVGDTTKLATAPLVDGKFTIKGSVNAPEYVYLVINGERVPMVLQNDTYEAFGTPYYKYVKGGKINETVFGYRKTEAYTKASKEEREMSEKYLKGIESGDLKALETAHKRIRPYRWAVSKITNEHIGGVLESPNTPTLTKAYALAYHQDFENYDWAKKVALYDEYEKELPGNAFIIAQRKSFQDAIDFYAEQDAAAAPGSQFTDFEAITKDGKPITLGEVVAKNKYTLLEFWASWCGPCRGSFPHLKEMYAKYNDKGFEVFGMSLDKDPKAYQKASKEEQLPWIDSVDYNAFKAKAAVDYKVAAIPYTVLIGQDGKIIAGGDNIRGLALEEKLEELFAN